MNERSLLSALFYLRQIQLGYFDWHLHKDASKQPVLFWHEVLQKISVTPRYADSHFPLCFSHIFSGGYSAGYYSYLWADLYVAAVFERFKQYPSMREAGKDFRACFMGLGAPLDLKKQLEEDFLKAPQSIEPFMRSIGYGSKVVS
jgi:Zn-dependent oligopeptidase